MKNQRWNPWTFSTPPNGQVVKGSAVFSILRQCCRWPETHKEHVGEGEDERENWKQIWKIKKDYLNTKYWLVSQLIVFPTISNYEDKFAALDRAECDCFRGELDHDEPETATNGFRQKYLLLKTRINKEEDEPPDGERESEPDGDGVDHHGEVDVDQQEDPPTKWVLK